MQRVHIELTNVCEFNCRFCPKPQMTRPNGFMQTDLAKRIITEIGRKQICEKITLHVMGEPTLHPDFFKILAHASQNRVAVGLTTNGAGLGRKTGRRLLDYPLHQLDVSLQTPDAKSFYLRGAGRLAFEDYLDGILEFFAAYHARHPGTIFKFRFLNTRFPEKEMEAHLGPVRVISSTPQLRHTFRFWAGRIYDFLQTESNKRRRSMQAIDRLNAYQWNVIEIAPNVFFETYVLGNWGHAFGDAKIHRALFGKCFGMQDHFAVLYNGDLTLCCIDFDGRTAMGNLNRKTIEEVLASDAVGRIIAGFQHYRLVHPYCQLCLGGKSFSSWLLKPLTNILVLQALKPFFYRKIRLF